MHALQTRFARGPELDEDVLEQGDDEVHVLLRHVERRAEADRLRTAQQDQHVLVVRCFLYLRSVVGSVGIERDHEALAANIEQTLGVLLLQLLQALNEVGADGGRVLDEFVLFDDLQEAARANHVHQIFHPTWS